MNAVSAYALFEWLIVGGAVAISSWVAFGKFAPQLRRRLLAAVTGQKMEAAKGGGCGSGCDTCGSCENNPDAKKDQPVKFHR